MSDLKKTAIVDQTKEKLITEVKEFGTTFEVSAKLIQSILKSEIVNLLKFDQT